MNWLDNGDFEGGWFHPDGIPELQIPQGWSFHNYENETNPHDNNSWARFVRPEIRVLPAEFLPPYERSLFIRRGHQTLKIFKGHGAFFCGFSQVLDMGEGGEYQLKVPVYADLIQAYEDGHKVWADDAQGRDGLLRFVINGRAGAWHSLVPGQWNEPVESFTFQGRTEIEVQFMCPFPLINSGLFSDEWTLIASAGGTSPPAPEPLAGRIHLVPPDATWVEKLQVLGDGHPGQEGILYEVDAVLALASEGDQTVIVWSPERWDEDVVASLRARNLTQIEVRSWPEQPDNG